MSETNSWLIFGEQTRVNSRECRSPGRFGCQEGLLDSGYAHNAIRKAGLGNQVGWDHDEDTLDSAEGCDQVIVIVRRHDFGALLFPGPCFLRITDDASDLFSVLKKSVCDCSAYISCDSHDCEHKLPP